MREKILNLMGNSSQCKPKSIDFQTFVLQGRQRTSSGQFCQIQQEREVTAHT
jgi:hypothetical protein